MKKILLISISLLPAFFFSCVFDVKPVITGNRNVVTETRQIENFENLEVSTGLNIYITFGLEASLKVEADQNLHEVIKTECENGRLKVFSDANIRKAKAKNVIITIPSLSSIEVSSAGSVIAKNLLKTDEIEIEVSSAAELELQVEAKSLTIEVSSAGKAILNGIAEDVHAEVSSAGEIKAFELISQSCSVNASSAGHASFTAEQKLNAEASSAGSISYKGDPKDTNIEKSSGGSVTKK
jgi:hypothetical protein